MKKLNKYRKCPALVHSSDGHLGAAAVLRLTHSILTAKMFSLILKSFQIYFFPIPQLREDSVLVLHKKKSM